MPVPAHYTELDDRLPARLGIERVWSYRSERHGHHLVLPDGRTDLILRYKDVQGHCEGVVPMLAGPTVSAARVPLCPGTAFVGLRLRPGRAGRLVPNLAQIVGRTLEGTEAIHHMPALSSVPRSADDPNMLVTALERIMVSAVAIPPAPVNAAVERVHISGGRVNIASLAQYCETGERRLRRLFLRHVGLGPQAFASVIRFQRALRLLAGTEGHSMTIAAVAHEAGYADQAHMTRAFRRHGGFTPSTMPRVTLGAMPLST